MVSCRHGGVQVHLGVVPQEAERCHALSAPHQVLAVSPAHQGKILVLSQSDQTRAMIICSAVLTTPSASADRV